MIHRRRIPRDFAAEGKEEELHASLAAHPVPVLAQYADPGIPWQFWRGELYIAGFPTEDAAINYGKMHGWIK